MKEPENLAFEISTFFEKYDMLCGATFKEMYDATLNALKDRDVEIIIEYFRDIRWSNSKAQKIYSELLEYV